MHVTTLYCSGCDHDVAVVMTEPAPADAQANVAGEELACLEVGRSCTGTMCPLGFAEPSQMVHRLIRHGLPTAQLTRVNGYCEGCGMHTELALVGEHRASCLICGTTSHWEALL